jgi:hypothetical protein
MFIFFFPLLDIAKKSSSVYLKSLFETIYKIKKLMPPKSTSAFNDTVSGMNSVKFLFFRRWLETKHLSATRFPYNFYLAEFFLELINIVMNCI